MAVSGFPFENAAYLYRALWEVEPPDRIIGAFAFETRISCDEIRVTFPVPTRQALYGISIRENDSAINPPAIVKLVEISLDSLDSEHYTTCRYCTAVTMHQQKLIITHYSWPITAGEHQSLTISKVIDNKPIYSTQPRIDLSSGRIVIPGPNHGQKAVIDMALFYKY
ncbi:hypothetical protein BDN70DRAFT_696972 [Pholiota conissans]|uniref:Uncharacterized protein n=1 Tax=Pholiota conissans TaxID=109636 RepID=A0A9P5Z3Q0_9AGAR|nr:hypothetical protein BDN70DRAFT_696972 [Pholiota conissans]